MAAQADSLRDRLNDYLAVLFSEQRTPPLLFQAMNYSLLSPGKRLRPLLCMVTATTLGAQVEPLLPVAASIELIHCYSLIHDDLPALDNDDLRRGRPTNHRVYGEANALLAGDALLTYAFELLAGVDGLPASTVLKMIKTLSNAAGCYGMVGGQFLDVQSEREGGTLTDVKYIHAHKTAALIQAAVVMGALAASADERIVEAVRQYGLAIGLAFQIVDDVLDVTGSSAELGKMVGSDERQQKLTYPAAVGLEESSRLAQMYLDDALSSIRELPKSTSDALTFLAFQMVERRK